MKVSISTFKNSILTASLLFSPFFSQVGWAADSQLAPIGAPNAQPAANREFKERNFYEVLEDVLGDFEYDLKNANVAGLKDLAIRNTAMSENIPPSFKQHLELLLTERILRNSKTQVIQCLPCKAKKTSLNGDQVVITSPDTNPQELARIAKVSGIQHFMDVSFMYEPSGMILSLYITDPDTGTIIWSRSYNSETSRASAFRRGVDFNQIDDARKQTEYAPLIQMRLGLGFIFEPNIAAQTGCLALNYRMMERYDNRKKEVGFQVSYMVNASTIVNSSGSSTTDLYKGFGFNMTLLFLHTWNFIGEEENYNKIRGGATAGIGGTYANGYIGGVIRAGWEWRMAKHFAINLNLGYRPPASVFITGTAAAATITGVEYGLGIDYLF